MLNNWLRLTHVAYNMDYVKEILMLPDSIELHMATQQDSFSLDSDDGRAVAHWLETQVRPMNDGTETVTYSKSIY